MSIKLDMENNTQNNLSAPPDKNPADNSIISTQNANPQTKTANLDGKRNELLSGNKITDEVSSYLNDLGVKNDPSIIGNAPRPPEEKKALKQSIVRTYKSDAEEAIKMGRMSSMSIAIAEEKKKQKYEPISQAYSVPKSKKAALFIFGLLFVFAGIGAFNFNYIKEKIVNNPTPKKALQIESLITADSSKEFNLSELGKKDAGASLSELIKTADVKPNSIQNVYITKNITADEKVTKKTAESEEFMPIISSKIPDILLRSLSSEYMLGIHSWNGNQPFLILKTDSYENAFAGMLVWEENIAGDLSALFPRNMPPMMEEGTTTTEQILSYKKKFEDVLVINRDTRALRDEDGVIFLIYSLPDKETVIITSNTGTLAELYGRLLRSRMVR